MSLTRRTVLAAGAAAIAAPAIARSANPVGSPLDTHDALGLAKLVRKRKVSPTELLEDAIRRAEAMDARFNFMAQRHYDFGRKAIDAGLPQGPFTGVPWLLKDLHTYIAGEVTENGSRLYKGYRSQVTSELVKRYQRAGFVIFGKTTSPEFGLTGTTESTIYGATRNPWDPTRIAGGSSGGAAAAIAAGVIPAAHASDGGGSIRIPASCCGLFGLKPSRGRVPMGPLRTEGWGGMSTNHAISRSVRDSAAILDASWGPEAGSRYSAPPPRDGSFLDQVTRKPGQLRIALMLEAPTKAPVDPECIAAVREAAALCESLGHVVEEAAPKLDAAQLAFASFATTAPSLAADAMDRAKLLGIELGPDVLEPMTLGFIGYAKQFSAMDAARANAVFQTAAVTMAQFMERYDLVLTPTVASPPVELGWISLTPGVSFQEWGERAAGFTPFTQIANQTGQPAMSVPLGMSSKGLPIGVHFIGRYGAEDTLLRLAGQLERAAPWDKTRPKLD
ncbi:MAG: amidase [Sphingomonadaceae bacterium]|nr:amidase [Sphingomonadaceae bacterium]